MNMNTQGAEQRSPEEIAARANAEQNLRALRRSMNEFHAARMLTKQAQTGMIPCKYPPEQLAAYVRSMRDASAEKEAVKVLRDLLTYLHGREPTIDEMEAGPPEALGVWWFAPAILTGIAGGAWTLSNLFSYLSERERRLQADAGIQSPSMASAVLRVAVPVAVLAAAGGGGYWLYRKHKAGKSESQAKTKVWSKAKTKVMEQNEEPDEVEIEDEDDESEEYEE